VSLPITPPDLFLHWSLPTHFLGKIFYIFVLKMGICFSVTLASTSLHGAKTQKKIINIIIIIVFFFIIIIITAMKT
jgi:hypothetical protein